MCSVPASRVARKWPFCSLFHGKFSQGQGSLVNHEEPQFMEKRRPAGRTQPGRLWKHL